MHTPTRRSNILALLIILAGWGTLWTSYAGLIIGTLGAGVQLWRDDFGNLNADGAPYWDYPTTYRKQQFTWISRFINQPSRNFSQTWGFA